MNRFQKLSWILVGVLVAGAGLAAQAPPPAAAPSAAPSAIPLTADDLNQFAWRLIGPWSFSGRIANVAVPRGQSLTYYALAASGGIWKTVDGGIHFEPIFDKYGNMSMGFLAIAPSNQDILYLGTGEPMHARSSAHGNGMWRSADAGKTWTHIGLEESYYIPKVEVDFKNPDIVYAAAEGKLYTNEPGDRGLYKTTDGGKTWTRVLDLKDRGVADFVIDPTNSDVVIVSPYRIYRRAWTFVDKQPGNFLWKTTDGGKTWKKLTAGLPDLAVLETGRNGLAVYEKNPKIVYVRLDEEVNLGLSEREGTALFRERDLFRDDWYLNKFKTYKIRPELARLVKFTPVTADKTRDLATKLNDMVRDGSLLKSTGVDLKTFNAAARKAYAKDKDVLAGIDEIEKIMKKDAEKPGLVDKVNGLVVLALFSGSEGIDLSNGVKVTAPDKVKMNKDFTGLLTYDPKGVKDEKDLVARLADLSALPDFTVKLKIDTRRVMSQAQKTYKDDKALAERFKAGEDLAKDYEDVKGRYQLYNRYLLQTLYGDALKGQEAVKKPGVIYRSDDQGESWARMTEYKMTGGSDPINPTEAGYYGRMVIDPSDDKVIYCPDTRMTKSTDAGKTFKFMNVEGNLKTHVDHRAAWVDGLNPKHLITCNDGGLSETWDGGSHWSQKETIAAQQFYDVSVDNQIPYNVMGGTQDNGCWIGPSMTRNPNGVYPADWLYLPTGDGFYAVRDWWNPEYLYFESQFGSSTRMNLKTGETIGLARRNTPEEDAEGKPDQRYQWNAPIVLSPHNPGIVFVCSQYVHRSLSHGDPNSWQTVSPDLTRADAGRLAEARKTNLQYATIFTFAESPLKPGLYWAGTDDGNLQMSLNAGETWTNITFNYYEKNGKPKPGVKGAVIPYDRWVKRVVPSAHDVNTCYVVYSGYRTHNEDKTYIYVTHDQGKTFEDIGGGMNNAVWDLEEDPDNPAVLYIGTEHGVFVTFDKGKAWSELSTTAPDVIMKDLAIQHRDRDLVVATYGRGIYVIDIFPFKEFKEDTFKAGAHLFDIEDAVLWNQADRRGQTLGEFAKSDNPARGATLYYYLKSQASKVTLVVKDASGAVVQEVNGKVAKGLQRVTWGLNKKIDREAMQDIDFRDRQRLMRLDPGLYTVTLNIDGKDVETKPVNVKADPLDRPLI